MVNRNQILVFLVYLPEIMQATLRSIRVEAASHARVTNTQLITKEIHTKIQTLIETHCASLISDIAKAMPARPAIVKCYKWVPFSTFLLIMSFNLLG